MKQILLALIIISFLAGITIPQVTLAVTTQAATSCAMKYDLIDVDAACTKSAVVKIEDYGLCCIINTLYSITDWIFVILVSLTGLFVIIGAFNLLTSAGSPDKVTSGRNYIMYAAIGLIVALLAKAIPNMVEKIAGIG